MKKCTRMMLTVLMSMMGANAFAQDIAVENSQGKMIYYRYCNDGRELAVSKDDKNYGKAYSGDVIIPEEVTYMNRTRKVTAIGYSAFACCFELTSLTLPNSINKIESRAFESCRKLRSLTIPDGVTSIGKLAFVNSGLTSVTIPSSVKTIDNEAFWNSGSLTSVTISNGVKTIGEKAFKDCKKLSSITIPGSVEALGDHAFEGCSSLVSVNIEYGLTNIGYNTFSECSMLSSVTIPNSVTKISSCAFALCEQLTSVTIPPSLKEIKDGAFIRCSKISAVHITDLAAWCKINFGSDANPLRYAHRLFLNGTEIKDIVIPEGVTSISKTAFAWLNNLNSLTLPKSITNIGGRAFQGSDITTIYCNIVDPTKIFGKTSDSGTFSTNTFNNATLYVPAGTIGKYQATEGWKDFIFIEEKK